MKARTSIRPETLAQVDQWETTKRRYLRAGLCHKCAAQAAWATSARRRWLECSSTRRARTVSGSSSCSPYPTRNPAVAGSRP